MLFLTVYGWQAFQRFLHPKALAIPTSETPSGSAQPVTRRHALLSALAFSWLNPHAWLDTAVLIGTASLAYAAINPAIGLGTWDLRGRTCARIVEQAQAQLAWQGGWQDPSVDARATLRNVKTNVVVSLVLKAAFLLLAVAGLLRPEAWLLSGVYFLWMSCLP